MSAPPDATRLARVLIARAEADLSAVRVLVRDPGVAEEISGFHAQQAVEKSLRAALILFAQEPPHTHDLAFLVESVEGGNLDAPISLKEATSLYPYAVEFRYDDAPAEVALPEAAMLEMAERAVAWVKALIGASDSTPP